MEALLNALAEHLVWVSLIGCVVVGMAIKSVTTILTGMSQERSRREIAAYVAEGSITPEHGERLIRADIGGSGEKNHA